MLNKIIISTTAILLLAFNYFACSNKDKNNDDCYEEEIIAKNEDSLVANTDNDEHNNDINNGDLLNESIIVECEDCYYYNFEEKIFMDKVIDKIFLTFSPNADENQKRAFVNSYSSLKLIDGWFDFNSPISRAALQSQNGNPISIEIIDDFINNSMITSATYMYSVNGTLYGLTDQIVVKLNDNTTYEQLVKLAEQNECKIVEKCKYIENRFVLSVPKTSVFNSMQMSCLFYETGFFEYTTPSMFFDAF